MPPRAPRVAARPAMPRPMPMLPVLRSAIHDRAPEERQTQPLAPRAVPVAAPRPAPLRLGNATCCWPIGEPGTPGFRFCGAPAIAGKPYCEEHAAVAYVRAKPDRREDAA